MQQPLSAPVCVSVPAFFCPCGPGFARLCCLWSAACSSCRPQVHVRVLCAGTVEVLPCISTSSSSAECRILRCIAAPWPSAKAPGLHDTHCMGRSTAIAGFITAREGEFLALSTCLVLVGTKYGIHVKKKPLLPQPALQLLPSFVGLPCFPCIWTRPNPHTLFRPSSRDLCSILF